MRIEDVRWLVSPEGAALVAELAEDAGSLVAAAGRLQRRLAPERAHLILEQVELRRRAAAKFPAAGTMFFWPQTLEQATDAWVAAYKARRFAESEPVADLCCGIGGDLVALAGRGPVTGVDLDEATLVLAEANAAGAKHCCRFVAGSVEDFSVSDFAAWHLDPDRRASGRRTTQIAAYAPGLETIDRLRREQPSGAVKLAPATEVPGEWRQEVELEWISRDRQCRQQVAWFGGLAKEPGACRATVLRAAAGGDSVVGAIAGDGTLRADVGSLGRYLFEPDAAVLAADLGGALAAKHGLVALHPAVPYLTGDEPIADGVMQCFEISDELPFDRKRLKALLRKREIGRLEIKVRGVDDSPEQIRRRLQLRGPEEAVLVVVRLDRSVRALVGRRVGGLAGNLRFGPANGWPL